MFFKLQRLVFLSLTMALGIATQAQAQSGPTGFLISPGIYQIETNGNLCVVSIRHWGLVQFDFLEQRPCSEAPTGDPTTTTEGKAFAFVPTGSNQFRIRLTTANLCATVARGFAVGNRRINLLPCDGNVDQEFRMGASADSGDPVLRPSLFIHTQQQPPGGFFASDFLCWGVREISNQVGIDIVEMPCTASTAQAYFHLVSLGPLTEPQDVQASFDEGFLQNRTNGWCSRVTSDTRLLNTDLPGNSRLIPIQEGGASRNDARCHQRCINTCTCSAYSWAPRNSISSTDSVCFMKTTPIPAPSARSQFISGVVRR